MGPADIINLRKLQRYSSFPKRKSQRTVLEKLPTMEQLKQHLSTLNQKIASVVERL
jgi:hypothetical protein